MAENLTGGTENFLKQHPYAAAGIVLGVVLVVWWLVSSGSSATPVAGTGSTDDTGTTDAAAIQAAQLTANGNLATAQLSAQALNNQTAAGLQIGLASIAGQQASTVAQSVAAGQVAQFNSAAEIAASNSGVAIAQAQVQGDEQLSNNATLASEYASLGGLLSNFFGSAGASGATAPFGTATQSSGAGQSSGAHAGGAPAHPQAQPTTTYIPAVVWQSINPADANYVAPPPSGVPDPFNNGVQEGHYVTTPAAGGGNLGGGGNAPGIVGSSASSFQQSSTPVVNPNVAAVNSGFLTGFGGLLAGLGVGLQTPQTQSLSPTQVLSLASINMAGVNNVSGLPQP